MLFGLIRFLGKEYRKPEDCPYMTKDIEGETMPVCDFCQFRATVKGHECYGRSWCWKKFRVVDWGDGCDGFRCKCLHWKKEDNGLLWKKEEEVKEEYCEKEWTKE